MKIKILSIILISFVLVLVVRFNYSNNIVQPDNIDSNVFVPNDTRVLADGYSEDADNIYYEGKIIFIKHNKQNPLIDASEFLKSKIPKDNNSIYYIMNTYYELTQHYGNYSEYNIFNNEDPEIFFEEYFKDINRSEFDLLEFVPFRLAFVATNSPFFHTDFIKPIGPGIGGGVVSIKNIDKETILAYGYGGSQAYMGPSGNMCKESGMFIDKFTFKKINNEWKIWDIENGIDSWITNNEGNSEEECKEINQDKIKKYQNL